VRRIAASVSESLKLLKYSWKPFSSAVANTVISGANSSAARNSSEVVMNAAFATNAMTVSRPGRLAISASTSCDVPGPAI
jgi:hypothetical protein